MPKVNHWTRAVLCLCLMLVFSLITGCERVPINLPTPDPTPTLTPTPAPEIAPGPYPPVVMSYAPLPGKEVAAADALITLHFDQAMDRPSLTEALQVRPERCAEPPCPAVAGEWEWQDSRTAHFRPEALGDAARYRVALSDAARSAEGVPLATELAFAFVTLSPLQVTRVEPSAEIVDARADVPIYVTFNRPVVARDCVGQPAQREGLCPAFTFTFAPSVIGSGTWVNPSIYRFDALGGWQAGEVYEVTLQSGVTGITGAKLEVPYSWTFETAAPYLEGTAPAASARNVPLHTNVRLQFNTPMYREYTGGDFSLTTADGTPVPGTIVWENGGATLVFTPTESLEMATRYIARLGSRARAITSAPLENPVTWAFDTVPFPSVVSVSPADGSEGVPVREPVRVQFAGDIDPDTLRDHVHITPEVDAATLYTHYDARANVYSLSWDKRARTEYCVTAQPGIADRYGNALEESSPACFTTGDLPPYVGLAHPLDTLTLDASQPAVLHILARNQNRVSFELFRLNQTQFLSGERTGGQSTRTWNETLNPLPNEALIAPVDLVLRGGPLSTGYYRVAWDPAATEGPRSVNIAVVDTHVTLKLATQESLVWLTDLQSGIPLSRTTVSLVDQEGLLIAAGTTDLDGLVRIPISPRDNLWEPVAAVVGNPGEAGFGIAMTNWHAETLPWESGVPVDYGPFVPYTAYLHTERPLYSPDQTVHFRGIVRRATNAVYSVPAPNTPISVTVQDAWGTLVYSTTHTLSESGAFDGSFYLPEDARAGRYTLQATLPQYEHARHWTTTFEVATHHAPDFQVDVSAQYAHRLQGNPLPAVINATYAFGGPVSAASVHWVVWAEPYTFVPEGVADGWPWGANAPDDVLLPQVVAEGTGTTDARGQFVLELPTELTALGADAAVTSQRWTLAATLTDTSGLTGGDQDTVIVHAAEVYLGLHPQRRVHAAGEDATLDLRAVDWDNVPIAGQSIDVTLARRSWDQVISPRPFAEPTWVYTDTVISSQTYVTDDDGEATVIVSPPTGGTYVIIAESVDSARFPTRAETLIWAGGASPARWPIPEGQLRPVADAPAYEVGDTARILVPTPFAGPYELLMTVERDNIFIVEHLVMDEANPIIEVPILDNYAPNVYVSFVIVRGADETVPVPDVRAGYVSLAVTQAQKALQVTLTPDQSTPYAPGDIVELTVHTSDADGQPVDAEVGLAVFDKGLLTLRPDTAPTLMETFHSERPLSVVMGDSLLVLANRIALQRERVTRAADRAIAEALMSDLGSRDVIPDPVVLRETYPETALWEAQVRTGERGQTQVSFELPDTLTTWVADARAITADTRVGQGHVTLVATRPLLVRPITPRFLVMGDRVEVAAIVHNNNTAAALDVTVRLEATGGVQMDSAPEQLITVRAGDRARVAWRLAVPPTSDDATRLTFFAESGEYQATAHAAMGDPETGALPIYRYQTPDTLGMVGLIDAADHRVKAVVVPPDAGRATALTLRVEPSLVPALLHGHAYLEAYPYTFNDVLISRLIAGAATWRAVQTWDAASPEHLADIEAALVATEAALVARQNADGGWGWWRDESTLDMTARAVYGLAQADEVTSAAQEAPLDRAIAYIAEQLTIDLAAGERGTPHALALYALSATGTSWPPGASASLYVDRVQLGVTGQAYLALALGRTDASDPRAARLLDDLREQVFRADNSAHWEDADPEHGGTDVLATALALNALTRLAPDDALVSPAARWLLQARAGATHWPTVYETAWAITALADYGALTDVEATQYTWGVTFNGIDLTDGLTTATALSDAWVARIAVSEDEGRTSLWRNRGNVLEIVREDGPGLLHYATRLSLARQVDQIAAEDRGILLHREHCGAEGPLIQPLDPCIPRAQVRPGDMVDVRLTLIVPEERHFVMLDAPYPAGMEPAAGVLPGSDAGDSRLPAPFAHGEPRADRAIFFARTLPPGTYHISYRLRAAIPGTYRVLPAVVSELYFPEVWGRTSGALMEVVSPD